MGWCEMRALISEEDIQAMTPKQRVFGTLQLLIEAAKTEPDLNDFRDQLVDSLEKAASWEPCLCNTDQA